jgi:Protein of unknown function (DUF1566)
MKKDTIVYLVRMSKYLAGNRQNALNKVSLLLLVSVFCVTIGAVACDDGGGIADVEDGETVPAPVPQTGQTTCWAPDGAVENCSTDGRGQDGDIRAGVVPPDPRFTDNGDGTITDNLTGLIWLKNADCFGQRNWEQALADANALADPQCGLSDGSVAGDWRLPNRKELGSLLDFENFRPPLPTGHPFITLRNSFYWSSTTVAGIPDRAWSVVMIDGMSLEADKADPSLTFVTAVRNPRLEDEPPAPVPQTGQTTCWNTNGNVIDCADTGQDGEIRAGIVPPDPRFTDNGDGTITDNLTGLIWLKDLDCHAITPASWSGAIVNVRLGLINGNCGLTDGSRPGDWRLPNRNELESLLDFENFSPALPPGYPFINARISSFYWSSTTVAGRPDRAWIVIIGSGTSHGAEKTPGGTWVTAVRDPF